MEQVIATIFNVLILSSMYILVALGFAFLFNMLGILNLAHGAIYMVGGYIGYALITSVGINPWLAIVVATLIMAGVGVLLERYCFRPFTGDFNRIVMVGVAINIVLQTAVNAMLGTEMQALPALFSGYLRFGMVSVSYQRISIFIIGAAMLVLVFWFVKRTKRGQQMQAISQDIEGAALSGINVHRVSALACALGSGLAALAGCLMGSYLMLSPYMGDLMLIKALVLVILAGIGSVGGIFVTGLLLGTLDAVAPVVFSGAVADAIPYVVVVVVLLVRPRGFFGREA
jgi:branched-chain amino acid transport system permease protein